MLKIGILNDWKPRAFGFFYFNIFRIEVAVGNFAIFYIMLEPTGVRGNHQLSVIVLGLGFYIEQI